MAAKDISFEDIRIDMTEWQERKANTTFGQIPILEVNDGKGSFEIAQSIAIARYLANKLGLAGKNYLENVKKLISFNFGLIFCEKSSKSKLFILRLELIW